MSDNAGSAYANPLGVSTCWRSRSIRDGRELIRAMADLGAAAVELDFRLSGETLEEALKSLKEHNLPVVSIHAVCPAPKDKKDRRVAEAHVLSSADEDERKKAVADAVSTLRLASRVGVRPVVLHAGDVPMERATYELQRWYDRGELESAEGQQIINRFKIERLGARRNTFDQLLKSLEELSNEAEKLDTFVCLENRYHMSEYPNFEELAIIFQSMAGGRIRYWHDVGHGAAQENLGVTPHEAYLKEFGDVLVGVHLHDIDGYTDHLAPPAGGRDGVDFDMVKKHLRPETLRVMELNGDVSSEKARAGLDWLAEKGLA